MTQSKDAELTLQRDSVPAEESSVHAKPDKDTPRWQIEEWKAIRLRRQSAFRLPDKSDSDQEDRNEALVRKPPENLTGVCLSGGGIRSAIFNDGFLQGLSHCGVLRYVDYLCSVSGGGYIAGHLTSQRNKDSSCCFHDDVERASLGRDMNDGRVERKRLMGIGGYLSRPLTFIPTYLWSLIATFAFYIGGVGVVATLIAMLWRSLDNPSFRHVYGKDLGLFRFGDELTIAFLPVLPLLLAAGLLEVICAVLRSISPLARYRGAIRDWQTRGRGILFLVFLCCLLSAVAIYLGNGKVYVGNSGESVVLNHYAQGLAVVAGIIQVAVFLGRDRLFRSEMGSKKRWHQQVQQLATGAILLFFFFSMVHWMGREDISNYTAFRDPDLVVGDLYSADELHKLFGEFENKVFANDANGLSVRKVQLAKIWGRHKPQLKDSPRPGRLSKNGVPEFPNGAWERSVAASRWIPHDWISGHDRSDPVPPLGTMNDERDFTFPERWWQAGKAYWASRSIEVSDASAIGEDPVSNSANSPKNSQQEKDKTETSRRQSDDTPPYNVRVSLDRYRTEQTKLEQALRVYNVELHYPQLTHFLVDRLVSKSLGDQVLLDRFKNLTAQQVVDELQEGPLQSMDLPASQLARLRNQIAEVSLKLPLQNEVTDANSDVDYSNSNRVLLEAALPSVVQSRRIASTQVVYPHDRKSRQRWLLTWMIVFAFGIVCGFLPSRITTVYQFYRRQLSRNFLRRTRSSSDGPFQTNRESLEEDQFPGNKPLHQIQNYQDGLPYPLVLAATLQPAMRNGSYHVDARPFVFSPKFCGSFEDGELPIESTQVSLQSFSLGEDDKSVTLSDAVTLSGAAVTPLMTKNRWLSIILDFFNSGIGQVVVRHGLIGGRSKASLESRSLWLRYLGAAASGLAAGIYLFDPFQSWWPAVSFCPLLGVLVYHAWRRHRGSIGLIRSLLSACEPDPEKEARFNEQRHFYVADGGYCDYLGVSELLRRRCRLIIASDAGANVGDDSLGTLARMCDQARSSMGVQFLDLDHEAPIDFGRLEMNEERLVHQPFICMRVRYPAEQVTSAKRQTVNDQDGLLVYCQMSITKSDPLEIKQIRNLFPTFPDEPTVNQFYNPAQVDAYRNLGFHIAKRVANEMTRWHERESVEAPPITKLREVSADSDPTPVDRFYDALCSDLTGNLSRSTHFDELLDRLTTAYRLACYEETTYNKDDIFSEAIWPSNQFAFPTFRKERHQFLESLKANSHLSGVQVADRWLRRYELNADIRSAYRTAVLNDINSLGAVSDSFCGVLWWTLCDQRALPSPQSSDRHARTVEMLAAHLACIAVACQEIHQGRPHAALQVGGRAKLMSLCGRFADRIVTTAPRQSHFEDYRHEDLISDVDSITAELIEMERSVFQGGEHVSTVSFAQCLTNAWGQIARGHEDQPSGLQNRFDFVGAFGLDGPLRSAFNTVGEGRPSLDLVAAELKLKLHKGMKQIELNLVRNGLVTSWYLGFMQRNELERFFELDDLPDFLDPEANLDSVKRTAPAPR